MSSEIPPTGKSTEVNLSNVDALFPNDDIKFSVAVYLKLKELIKSSKEPIDAGINVKTSDFNDLSLSTFRYASQAIVDQYFISENRNNSTQQKAEDPLYLLLSEEIRERTDNIHTVVNSINQMLSFRSQILIAAVAGIAISVFILITTLIPASLDVAIRAWKSFLPSL